MREGSRPRRYSDDMRVLPRSPRGNWLLATAAWLGLCGLVWLFLPPQPRAEWPVDAPTSPIGFIPGTRTLIAGRVVAAWRDGGPTVGPVRSYDPDTGRVVDWLPPDESVRQRTIVLSPDGKRATVRRGESAHFAMQLFDPIAGRKIADLPLAAAGDVRAVSFSADGQLLAYAENGDDGGCVHVWDISAGRKGLASAHRAIDSGLLRMENRLPSLMKRDQVNLCPFMSGFGNRERKETARLGRTHLRRLPAFAVFAEWATADSGL